MLKTVCIGAVAALSVALSGCASRNGLADLATSLNARGCATEGTATASAGVTGASIGGNLKWSCTGPAKAPEVQ